MLRALERSKAHDQTKKRDPDDVFIITEVKKSLNSEE